MKANKNGIGHGENRLTNLILEDLHVKINLKK